VSKTWSRLLLLWIPELARKLGVCRLSAISPGVAGREYCITCVGHGSWVDISTCQCPERVFFWQTSIPFYPPEKQCCLAVSHTYLLRSRSRLQHIALVVYTSGSDTGMEGIDRHLLSNIFHRCDENKSVQQDPRNEQAGAETTPRPLRRGRLVQRRGPLTEDERKGIIQAFRNNPTLKQQTIGALFGVERR